MAIEQKKEDALLDTLPFTVEEETDHIKLVSKKSVSTGTSGPRSSTSKGVTVEVHLFDRGDLDRLNAINVDPPKKVRLLDRIIRRIK